MSKVLVVYGTKSGSTKGSAEKIGETVENTGAQADVVAAGDTPDPTAYDAVIVGSGIRARQWHREVREWVSAHADALKARATAFFTACLTLATAPEKTDEVSCLH